MNNDIVIDISSLFEDTKQAKLAELPHYERSIIKTVPPGSHVTLTGPGPVWLYLKIAHKLHGIARSLSYSSPVTGNIEIFNHDPN